MSVQNSPAERLQGLREQRSQALARANAIAERLGTASWVADTDTPALQSEQRSITELEAQIVLAEAVLDVNVRSGSWATGAAFTAAAGTAAPGTTGQTVTSPSGSGSAAPAFHTDPKRDTHAEMRSRYRILNSVRAVSGGRMPDGLEGEMHQEAVGEARQRNLNLTGNIHLPSFLMSPEHQVGGVERRDITATTAATGGYTIATKLGQIIDFLYPRMAVLQMGATYFSNQSANLAFPRNTTAATAVWASTENATSTETTPNFDLLSLTPKRLTAYTDVSKQNLVQSDIAMENFVRNQLNMAIMLALDLAAISGTGTGGQPLGIMGTSGINDVDLGANGGLLDWSKIVSFETKTAMENADMGNLGYLTTTGVAGFLKTTKKDIAGNGFIWEGPNQKADVNGYRAIASNQMPSNLSKNAGTNLHAAIFGNFAELIIGQWGGLDLMINPYTKGKEALVELIVHAFYDLGVRHAKSFTVCNEISIV